MDRATPTLGAAGSNPVGHTKSGRQTVCLPPAFSRINLANRRALKINNFCKIFSIGVNLIDYKNISDRI